MVVLLAGLRLTSRKKKIAAKMGSHWASERAAGSINIIFVNSITNKCASTAEETQGPQDGAITCACLRWEAHLYALQSAVPLRLAPSS